MDAIDLRSDTVSWPTPEMREAMANAVVGDDVYNEDPTVKQLEQDSADMLGHEAGLFVTSGTQGNLIAMLVHCGRGAEVIMGDKGHSFMFEGAGMSALGGLMPHLVPVQPDGTLKLADIEAAIRGDNVHFPRTKLVMLENTHNMAGGVPLTAEYTNRVADLAHQHGLKLHIDGARIFNAATALNVEPRALAENADSLTFCLSKGLCAPVGSILVGSKAFIAEARRQRKALGGGMRQVGVVAAAGLIAIHTMTKRLHEDHENAALLAEGLSEVPGITVLNNATNFVLLEINEDAKLNPVEFVQKLKNDYNILINPYPGLPRRFRLATHYWITRDRVETVSKAMKTILS